LKPVIETDRYKSRELRTTWTHFIKSSKASKPGVFPGLGTEVNDAHGRCQKSSCKDDTDNSSWNCGQTRAPQYIKWNNHEYDVSENVRWVIRKSSVNTSGLG
jgi:hypothetical protein